MESDSFLELGGYFHRKASSPITFYFQKERPAQHELCTGFIGLQAAYEHHALPDGASQFTKYASEEICKNSLKSTRLKHSFKVAKFQHFHD